MRSKLSEPLSIDDMARFAMYSKFHFSREFHRITGISPKRFLSALRIQEAKRLLLTTGMTVTDISCTVGYSSVGTFSSRFTNSVGLPPSVYRQFGGYTTRIKVAKNEGDGESVRGLVVAPAVAELGLIFLGLFPTRVPEGRPISCAVLRTPGPFEMRNVPPGVWYLLGHSVPATAHEALTDGQPVHVGSLGPLEIGSRLGNRIVEFRLRGVHVLDPPVLMALQKVRSAAFENNLVGEAG
ncbi:MAG TPA: helix-turn-helix transcriptional regulator [Streptomyces sp.]|uniref:helix-turn-helix transcriptional regulator n=1 Tax=Streptomyces sp. TaxID=1931 RepID=UPI002CC92D05|nr:helix-turn-helix transcriptional regulator [Streptomyces sp.]HWU11098.1 helix-turn-helix transcriptional regulator [Streptomyces sp.]